MSMKRSIALGLVLILAFAAIPGLALAARADALESESVSVLVDRDMDALKIGVLSALSGDFFTDMWGNNTSDMDVRALIHGHSTVGFNGDGNFALDATVVREATVSDGPDGRTYAFEINDGLKYSDGTPITAADYAFSALLLSDPRMTDFGSVPGAMAHLAGFEAYVDGVREAEAEGGADAGQTEVAFSGVRLISDTEFSLTVKADRLPYFYELTMVDVKPYPIHVIAPECEIRDDGAGAYIAGEFTPELLEQTVLDPETGYRFYPMVGSGPYVLDSYDRDTHVAELSINPAYAGNFEGKKPQIERLTILPANQQTMVEQLQTGKLDLIHKLTSGERINQAQALVMSGELRAQNYLRAGLSFLSFACEQGVTQSAGVRQAIAMCADPQALVDAFLKGYGLVSYGYYGYGQWMAEGNDETLLSLARYALNVNAAIGLLEADGWVLGEDGAEYDDELGGVRHRAAADGSLERLSVRFAYPANTDAIDALKPMLEANMALAGFELECIELPFDELLRQYYRQQERGFEMCFMGTNFALTFDPYHTFATDDAHQGVFNTTGILDDQLMQLAADMRATEPDDKEGYLAKWEAFQQRFVEVLPLAPLYGNIYFDFFRTDLQDYNPNAHWGIASALMYAYLGEPVQTEDPDSLDSLDSLDEYGESETFSDDGDFETFD